MAREQLIVMLQGMGNNERGWAQMLSRWGRVVLIQLGLIEHVEVWAARHAEHNGPERSLRGSRKLDEALLSSLTMLRAWRLVKRFTKGQKIDLVIASNYNLGLVALCLRRLGQARKVVVVLTDHLPPRGSWLVRLHRRVTGAMNAWVAGRADEAWAVSPRIPALQANDRRFVVPLCLNENPSAAGPREEVGYIGMPSPDHALEILFEVCRKHDLRLNLIGDSEHLRQIRGAAPPGTVFHGLLNDPTRINQILQRCFCGYAVYRNTGPGSYSYYGIPSKTLAFFSSDTPVVTTNTAHFTAEIDRRGIGRVVEPVPEAIEAAILELKTRCAEYQAAIRRFRSEWNVEVTHFHRERLNALGLHTDPESPERP